MGTRARGGRRQGMASPPNTPKTIIQPRDLGALTNWPFSQRRGSARPVASSVNPPPSIYTKKKRKRKKSPVSIFGYNATAPIRDCLYSVRTPLIHASTDFGFLWQSWRVVTALRVAGYFRQTTGTLLELVKPHLRVGKKGESSIVAVKAQRRLAL